MALAGCAMVDEPRLAPSSIVPGQRTVVLVYPSPGPWVIREADTKPESAAKILPGLGFLVEAAQDERDLGVSNDLKQYLPRWTPAELFAPLLVDGLAKAGYPGKLLYHYQAELATETVRGFNRAKDVLDWQKTYYYEEPDRPLARDYSRLMALDDALVLEVNLRYGCLGNDDGNMVPRLTAYSRLLRASTMKPLWRREAVVEDLPGAKSLYEFQTLPLQLIDRWKLLLPPLAAKVVEDMRASALASLGASSGTATSIPGVWPGMKPPAPSAPAVSTAAVSAVTPASMAPSTATATVVASSAATTTATNPATVSSTTTTTAPAVAASSDTSSSPPPETSTPTTPSPQSSAP